MTKVSDVKGTKSTLNSNSSLTSTAYTLRNNTAQSGTTTSITLDASASAVDDTYNNLVIEITDGTGVGQTSLISDYNGTTKVATVTFGLAPDSTSKFTIHINSGICQEQDQTTKYRTIKLASTASSFDNFYNGAYFRCIGGLNKGQYALITDYDGTTKVATINRTIDNLVDSTTLYAIYGEGGTAASATSTTIVLEASHGHSSTDDYYNGLIISILTGTGSGQVRTISDYVGSTRTVTVSDWTTTPDDTSTYIIYGGWTGQYESVLDYSEITYINNIGIDKGAIVDFQFSLDSTGINKKIKTVTSTTIFESDIHTMAVISEYFRLRMIGMGTALTGNVQIIYHTAKGKPLTTFINEEIRDHNDCELTRSIIAGKTSNGRYNNIQVDSAGHLNANILSPRSSFGELFTVSAKPVCQVVNIYNIETVTVDYDGGNSNWDDNRR